MNTTLINDKKNKIMYIAFLGFATVCLLSCMVFTMDLIHTEALRPIGCGIGAIITGTLFVKELYKIK